MVKPIIVGAHYGFRDWLLQRVTAVVMAIYTVVFAICALLMPDSGTTSDGCNGRRRYCALQDTLCIVGCIGSLLAGICVLKNCVLKYA